MESYDLDAETAGELARAVAKRLRFFGELHRRMELRGLRPTDPLCRAVSG